MLPAVPCSVAHRVVGDAREKLTSTDGMSAAHVRPRSAWSRANNRRRHVLIVGATCVVTCASYGRC
jgi:hypothetical protein